MTAPWQLLALLLAASVSARELSELPVNTWVKLPLEEGSGYQWSRPLYIPTRQEILHWGLPLRDTKRLQDADVAGDRVQAPPTRPTLAQGLVYYFGGGHGDYQINDVQVYSPGANSWSVRAQHLLLPRPVAQIACSIVALNLVLAVMHLSLALLLVVASSASAAPDDFKSVHEMIKQKPGESRWMEIDWYPSVWEGRQIAAKKGKPIFLMAGAGGAPCAGC